MVIDPDDAILREVGAGVGGYEGNDIQSIDTLGFHDRLHLNLLTTY